MTNSALSGLAFMALTLLASCDGDSGNLPSRVGQSTFQRGLDQDIGATHESSSPTLRNQSPTTPANWR